MDSNNHLPGWIPASRGNFLLLTTSQISKTNKLQPWASKIFPAELRGGSGVCTQQEIDGDLVKGKLEPLKD